MVGKLTIAVLFICAITALLFTIASQTGQQAGLVNLTQPTAGGADKLGAFWREMR